MEQPLCPVLASRAALPSACSFGQFRGRTRLLERRQFPPSTEKEGANLLFLLPAAVHTAVTKPLPYLSKGKNVADEAWLNMRQPYPVVLLQ